jgi:ABC-2 type transport system permease protein
MRRYLKLIWLFVTVNIQDNAAYRTDLFVHILMTFLHFGAEMIGLWTIFSNTPSLGGWSAFEFLALLGVFRMMSGLIGLFIAPNMRRLMEDIRDGKLDYVVIKPIHSQFFVSFRRVIVWRLSDVVMGMILVLFACYQLSATLSFVAVGSFILMLASGTVIIYSFWLCLGTLAFWFTRISNIEMIFWNVFEAGRYPVDIYRPWIRTGLTYIIPLAFITTIPAGALVGKTEPGNLVIALVVATGALYLSSQFWRLGLRHYSGASA